MNNLDAEILLLEIEELFQRFRNVPQNTRVIILEKIRVKLLEEFKDFIVHDGMQDTAIIEIPYDSNAEASKPDDSLPELMNNIDKDLNITVGWKDGDLFSFLQPEIPEQPSNNTVNNTIDVHLPVKVPKENEENSSENIWLMCDHCGKRFRHNKTFRAHLKEHECGNDYECAYCSVIFNHKEDLIKHLKSHTKERTFVCPICKKRLTNNKSLTNHIRVIHEKEEKFSCVKCDYFAFSKNTLREHNRIKHEKLFKKYACVICKNVYNSRVLLKVHLRSHTGEKPYKCKECEAAFVCSGRLTNHMKSVHGEQKYSCDMCPKSFKTIHKLKRHSVIHMQGKPYACLHCNYATNFQGNLTKHIRRVHQMNDFSYFKYKKTMQGEVDEFKQEFLTNGECFTKNYLKELSDKGNPITLDRLKENYLSLKVKTGVESKSYNVDNLVQLDVFLNST